jgi:hypothetical protein
MGEIAGVCLDEMGGDGAREGRKEGVRRGVRVEDAREWRNRMESYLRDSTGCTYVQRYVAHRSGGRAPVPTVWITNLRIVRMKHRQDDSAQLG